MTHYQDPEEALDQAAAEAAPIFEAKGWEWATAENGTPTEEKIRETLGRLYRYVLKDDRTHVSKSGRFVVRVYPDGMGRAEVEVSLKLGTAPAPREAWTLSRAGL